MIDFVMASFKTRVLSVFLLTALFQWGVSCCCGHFPSFEGAHSGHAAETAAAAEASAAHHTAGHHCPHSSPGSHEGTPCEKHPLRWMVGPDGRLDESHGPNKCGGFATAAVDSSSCFEMISWALAPTKPPWDRARPHSPFGAIRLSTSRWLN